ncbi:MAG: hypothetical protein V1922_05805 [bacterium]
MTQIREATLLSSPIKEANIKRYTEKVGKPPSLTDIIEVKSVKDGFTIIASIDQIPGNDLAQLQELYYQGFPAEKATETTLDTLDAKGRASVWAYETNVNGDVVAMAQLQLTKAMRSLKDPVDQLGVLQITGAVTDEQSKKQGRQKSLGKEILEYGLNRFPAAILQALDQGTIQLGDGIVVGDETVEVSGNLIRQAITQGLTLVTDTREEYFLKMYHNLAEELHYKHMPSADSTDSHLYAQLLNKAGIVYIYVEDGQLKISQQSATPMTVGGFASRKANTAEYSIKGGDAREQLARLCEYFMINEPTDAIVDTSDINSTDPSLAILYEPAVEGQDPHTFTTSIVKQVQESGIISLEEPDFQDEVYRVVIRR